LSHIKTYYLPCSSHFITTQGPFSFHSISIPSYSLPTFFIFLILLSSNFLKFLSTFIQPSIFGLSLYHDHHRLFKFKLGQSTYTELWFGGFGRFNIRPSRGPTSL